MRVRVTWTSPADERKGVHVGMVGEITDDIAFFDAVCVKFNGLDGIRVLAHIQLEEVDDGQD